MFIGFGALNDLSGPNLDADTIESLHSTIILCAKILYNQSRNCYIAEAVYRLIKNSMPPQDVHKLRDFAQLEEIDEKREGQLTKHVQSEWPINIVQMPASADDRKLDSLLKAFKEFSFGETSTVDISNSGHS